MTSPFFSLCYTSRRPAAIADVINLWRVRAGCPGYPVEVILAVDADDAESIRVGKSLEESGVRLLIQDKQPYDCVKGWNLAASRANGMVLICIADDFIPEKGWGQKLIDLEVPGETFVTVTEQDADENGNERTICETRIPTWVYKSRIVHVNDGYIDHIATLAIVTQVRYNEFGYIFYPEFQSMFCTPAGTQIYMENHQFKPIEQIEVGDRVVGAISKFGPSGKRKLKRSFLVPTKVSQVFEYANAQIIKVTLESGKVLRCTPDHFWAYYSSPQEITSWARQDKRGRRYFKPVNHIGCIGYCQPEIGRNLVRVVKDFPKSPTSPDLIRDLAWLAGIYDGEGCDIFISQSTEKNKDVCDEIERILHRLDFRFSTAKTVCKAKINESRVYTILGGKQEYIRFFNWLKPVRWNRETVVKRMLTSRFGTKDKIVKIEDGGVENVFSIKTETGNYIADGYLSHNSDTDMTERAKLDGAVIPAKHLYFEHCHPTNNKRMRDSVDSNHDSKDRWARGEAIFALRQRAGFPRPGEVVKLKFAAYVMANKDDLCLFATCQRLMEQGVHDFFFCINAEYWSGRKTTDEEIDQVEAVAERLRGLGADCRVQLFSTLPYRDKGLKRLEIETYVRNDHLKAIRSQGFFHILIVDSDELFKPGLMNAVETAVKLHTPDAIKCWRIPVVGLPGVLVDNPRDNPEIYVGNWATFSSCRAVNGKSVLINGFGVYHFTAVRPTMDEIAQKHRESGHYDDQNYDFEGWIKDTMPTLGLNTKRVHMYRGEDIWPSTRPWTKKELSWIPEELHKFCDVASAVDSEPPTGPVVKTAAVPSQLPQLAPPAPKTTAFPTSTRLAPKGLYRRIGG